MGLAEWQVAEGRRNRPEPKEIVAAPGELFNIEHRKKTMVARPGSQRRCYNGCFPDSDWEWIWTPWAVLETDMPISRLDFWEDLNKKCPRKSKYRAVAT
tara:strand:+ start:22186 stop:22482 length:297 start_codon:yes stop_codon:yes gene_type:complete